MHFAGVEFILPTDVIIADKFDENANSKVVPVEEIPDGWMVSHHHHHYIIALQDTN